MPKNLRSGVIVYRNAAAFYGVNRTGLDGYVLFLPSVPDAMRRGSRKCLKAQDALWRIAVASVGSSQSLVFSTRLRRIHLA